MQIFTEKAARREHMLSLRKGKWTLARIGELYGITKQRVSQIIHTPKETPVRLRVIKARHRIDPDLAIWRKKVARRKRVVLNARYLDADLAAKFAKLYQPGMSANRLATLAATQWVHARRWLTNRNIAAPRIQRSKGGKA